jgi:Holliday junction resolvase
MVNKGYERGRAFEYKMVTYFKRRGYYVTRSAGSHGAADLVAVKKNQRPIFVQCKTGAAKVDMEEHNKLFHAALAAGARAIIVSKEARKPVIFKAVIGIALRTGDAEVVIEGME